MRGTAFATVVVMAMVPAAVQAEAVKIAVLPTQFDASTTDKIPQSVFEETLLGAAHDASSAKVIGADDLSAIIGLEKHRDLLGCDKLSCMAEIAGALDVQQILSAKLAYLDSQWTITIKLIRVAGTPEVLARSTEFVSGGPSDLLKALPDIARSVFAGHATSAPQTEMSDQAEDRLPNKEPQSDKPWVPANHFVTVTAGAYVTHLKQFWEDHGESYPGNPTDKTYEELAPSIVAEYRWQYIAWLETRIRTGFAIYRCKGEADSDLETREKFLLGAAQGFVLPLIAEEDEHSGVGRNRMEAYSAVGVDLHFGPANGWFLFGELGLRYLWFGIAATVGKINTTQHFSDRLSPGSIIQLNYEYEPFVWGITASSSFGIW